MTAWLDTTSHFCYNHIINNSSIEKLIVSWLPPFSPSTCSPQDNKVRVYSVSGDSLNEKTTIETGGEISAAAYSHTGEFLAITSGRSICTYDSASYQVNLCYSYMIIAS